MKTPNSSSIDPMYTDGEFYQHSSGGQDAFYKVEQLKRVLDKNPEICCSLSLVADVGCGTGKTTRLLHKFLSECAIDQVEVHGYDVHPEVSNFQDSQNVRFISGDFYMESEKIYDLVVLLDVLEHVLDPIEFLKRIAKRTRLIALHLPLDDSLLSWVRDLPKRKIRHPGHILVLNSATAFNLLTFSQFRIFDYAYSPVFLAPSGSETILQRLFNPIRTVTYRISPYLTHKIFGGVSIFLLAKSCFFLED